MSTSIALVASPARAEGLCRLLTDSIEIVGREHGGAPPDCVLIAHEPPELDDVAWLGQRSGPEGLPPSAAVVVLPGADPGIRRDPLRAGAQEILGAEQLDPQTLAAAIGDAIERFAVVRRLAGDLSARREAEAALRRSEEQSRQSERFAHLILNNLFAFVGSRPPASPSMRCAESASGTATGGATRSK